MKLNQLSIVGNRTREKSEGLVPFHWYTHHIKEMFLALLVQDIEIDGSSKITITIDHECSSKKYIQRLGTSQYLFTDISIDSFYSMTDVEQNKFTLDMLQKSLIDIVKINAAIKKEEDINVANKINIINETCKLIRSNNYALEIKAKNLSKYSNDRTMKASVYRCLEHAIGEAWYVEIEKKDSRRVCKEWLTDVPSYLVRTDYFKVAKWENEKFVLYNRLNQVTYSYEVIVE